MLRCALTAEVTGDMLNDMPYFHSFFAMPSNSILIGVQVILFIYAHLVALDLRRCVLVVCKSTVIAVV